MRRIVIFLVALVTWCLLAWPFGETLDVQSIVVGAVAALLVALILPDTLTNKPADFLNPVRWFWMAVYLPVFFYYIIKANLQVVYLVLHPEMPIRPGIVKVKTELATDTGRTALANCITLTPGTFTVDLTDDGHLYIHWLKVEATDEGEATERIVRRFERFLKRIFE